MIPGEIITKDEIIMLNSQQDTIRITVANTGDRPVRLEAITIFMRPIPPLNLIERLHVGCGLILPQVRLFGLNQAKNVMFS